jgi:cytochrome c-type biogenesis protein CcmH
MPLLWFLLGMLTTVAILCVLLPWLRTIPNFESLPALPWQAPLAALFMLLAAVAMYRWLGRPDLAARGGMVAAGTTVGAASTAIDPADPRTGGAAPNPATSASAGSMQSALASLEGKLAKGGGSDGDWELLAKSYEFVGRPDDAAKARSHVLPRTSGAAEAPASTAAQPATAQAATAAPPVLGAETMGLLAKAGKARTDKQYAAAVSIYSQLAARKQLNADGWADYADAAASAQGSKLTGLPEKYIDNALALDPQHPKALWLKASAEEEAGRMSAAVRYWQQLKSVLPADSEDARMVAANLKRDADVAVTEAQRNPDAQRNGDAASTDQGTQVSGEVTMANSLAGKATPGGTLFILAKSAESPGPPLAVFRGTVGAWPVKFTLDDSQSMLPGRNLSSAARVTVEARVSQSGQALPERGDLRGSSGVISPTAHEPLKIVINEVVQ